MKNNTFFVLKIVAIVIVVPFMMTSFCIGWFLNNILAGFKKGWEEGGGEYF